VLHVEALRLVSELALQLEQAAKGAFGDSVVQRFAAMQQSAQDLRRQLLAWVVDAGGGKGGNANGSASAAAAAAGSKGAQPMSLG
jgi:hypothetical protein